MQMLGVRIDEVNRQQAREQVRTFLHSDEQHTIFTPNPEMLVLAQKYPFFQTVLNSGSLNICDGFGLWLALRLSLRGAKGDEAIHGASGLPRRRPATCGTPPRNDVVRIPGSEFVHDIFTIAQQEGKSAFLLGTESASIIEKARDVVQTQYPNLKIVGCHPGPKISVEQEGIVVDEQGQEVIEDVILAVAPDILIVAFGQIKQECWIDQYIRTFPTVRVAIGVGGVFDVMSGRVSRAPRLFRFVGLEWLWRLILQPRRIWRIIDAVIVFPFLYCISYVRRNES